MKVTPFQIASQYRLAMEHPSEKARKKYLKDHPKADPKNHTVEKNDKGLSKTKSFFTGLSEKVKSFLGHSSAAVQKFVADEKHRATVLGDASKHILSSPKTYAKRLVSTAKHEIHEFKEAGEALAHLAKGKKLEPEQKKVLKTVALHLGIAVAASALTSTGVLGGAAVFGKSMAQKIALKAAARALENVHLVQEISHIGHGVHGLMHVLVAEEGEGKPEKVSPEEAFALLVMQSVAKELQDFDEKDLNEALEGSVGEQKKMAWNVNASDLKGLITRALRVLDDLEVWIKRFDRVLLVARSESSSLTNRVWQDRFVPYFEEKEESLEALRDLSDALEDVYLETGPASNLAEQARLALRVPRKAEVAYAISDIDFDVHPGTGDDGISYSIPRLKDWADEVQKWVNKGQQELKKILPKASRR